ncbi:MAG: hypothetical protein CUN51_05600 [Candidatus Thermofonsia Clade 1 bacterium]|uniref:STAS/SEC14 domain-containing protein n=1 Tax=Candidatus Thermofonsia Clade 1 bacterium TaxID=2364210 RepID=A0A2M8P091_9CHLR|nr:MAG: hypothetical protein CUN51_05600 [Candidatus Thermofonsia Clade 1 bacterium]
MPVTQELIENGRILLVVFTDSWTADQMLSHYPQAQQYYDAAKHPIHLLIDVSGARLSIPGALRAREAPALRHPMGGDVVVVGAQSVVRAIGETVFRVARFRRVTFFDTHEEGLAFLRARLAEESMQTHQS